MFEGLRSGILKLAQEEELRRQGGRSATSAAVSDSDTAGIAAGKKTKKKTPKKKYEQKVVNAERLVLFDFQGAKEYVEQLSVKANEIVFVFEHFEDGWSSIRSPSGQKGVVPTAYLGNLIDKSSSNNRSFFSQQFKQRVKVLGIMGLEQVQTKIQAGFALAFRATKFIVTNVIIPGGVKLFLIMSRNESYTTTISSATRSVYEFTTTSLIHSMNDDELAAFSQKLREDSTRIKQEKQKRKGLPDTATTEPVPVEAESTSNADKTE